MDYFFYDWAVIGVEEGVVEAASTFPSGSSTSMLGTEEQDGEELGLEDDKDERFFFFWRSSRIQSCRTA